MSVPVADGQKGREDKPDELELDEACGCEDIDSKRVDGRTKAYRETYTRIMNRLGKLREKNQKQAKEGWGGKGGVPGKGTVRTIRRKPNGGMTVGGK